MKLVELREQALNSEVAELALISLEGGTYVLEATVGERQLPVKDDQGRVLHLRSVEHARDLLKDMPPVPFYLVHAEVHDQMCGMAPAASEPLRVAMSLSSAW
ncbi:cation transporter [Pseudomonas sp. HAR-UPW-AIA-41]|uniref:DUF6482 family protein n=1 Tax=Pseudomonas sp. HAR-UPW-AIA-41 TaxID=1985301 RepID=UPI000BB3129B|nr:DUF6482 family protein [Pseudomonas sp. HAR-UPW-AIA-41]PAV48187.1 cation transporter [Pseudomonas sp. HAR-UPW-AIA-41]